MYLFVADLILIVHFTLILFVAGMCVSILLRSLTSWQWVYNYRLRTAHFLCMVVIGLQILSGGICGLTYAEGYLRVLGGQQLYSRTFIQHWLEQLVFIDAPVAVLGVVYVVVALYVTCAWFKDRRAFKPVAV